MTRIRLWPIALLLGWLALPGMAAEPPRLLDADEAAEWIAVGRVNIAGYKRAGMCSGSLIAADLVLTAAHCVINGRTGRSPRLSDIHFVAGWRKGKWRAHSTAAAVAIHPDYRPGKPPSPAQIAADLALIRLRAPIPAATVRPLTIATAPRAPFRLISYRRDRPHAPSIQTCPLTGDRNGVLSLSCPVIFGASGAPLLVETPGGPAIAAVLSAKRGKTAFATPLAGALDAVRAVLSAD